MPMTTRQLNRLFHEAADGAGIKKGVTLHALRHYLPRLTMSCNRATA
jgi:integrase/recombinase XerD